MNPSTPPRSRTTILSSNQFQQKQQKIDINNIDDDFLHFNNTSKKLQVPPETPKKNTGLDIPMTPSTILHHGYDIHNNNISSSKSITTKFTSGNALLAPPLLKFNGLRSPEFSPMRRLSIIPSDNDNSSAGEVENTKTNKDSVSRVLFPIDISSGDDNDSDAGDENDIGNDHDDDELFVPSTPPSKMAKDCPGTPSHQIVTWKQAKEWNNESYPISNDEGSKNRNINCDSDDENDGFIREAKLENPFMTSSSSMPLSKKERLERHQQLIKENPDIENVITYVNKRGEITKRRVLTSREKKRFKPRALIFKDNDSSDNE